MKLSKKDYKDILRCIKFRIKYYQKVQQMDVDQETKLHFVESQESLQDLHDKIADEIVRICEKTKLKNLR